MTGGAGGAGAGRFAGAASGGRSAGAASGGRFTKGANTGATAGAASAGAANRNSAVMKRGRSGMGGGVQKNERLTEG